MKKIVLCLSILFITSCAALYGEPPTFNIQKLNNYWRGNTSGGSGNAGFGNGELNVDVKSLPLGSQDSTTCNRNTGWGASKSYTSIQFITIYKSSNVYTFYNNDFYIIKNGKKYRFIPHHQIDSYQIAKISTTGKEARGLFLYTSPLSCSELEGAEIYIGGIKKDGKLLPPVQFRINYKTSKTLVEQIFYSI